MSRTRQPSRRLSRETFERRRDVFGAPVPWLMRLPECVELEQAILVAHDTNAQPDASDVELALTATHLASTIQRTRDSIAIADASPRPTEDGGDGGSVGDDGDGGSVGDDGDDDAGSDDVDAALAAAGLIAEAEQLLATLEPSARIDTTRDAESLKSDSEDEERTGARAMAQSVSKRMSRILDGLLSPSKEQDDMKSERISEHETCSDDMASGEPATEGGAETMEQLDDDSTARRRSDVAAVDDVAMTVGDLGVDDTASREVTSSAPSDTAAEAAVEADDDEAAAERDDVEDSSPSALPSMRRTSGSQVARASSILSVRKQSGSRVSNTQTLMRQSGQSTQSQLSSRKFSEETRVVMAQWRSGVKLKQARRKTRPPELQSWVWKVKTTHAGVPIRKVERRWAVLTASELLYFADSSRQCLKRRISLEGVCATAGVPEGDTVMASHTTAHAPVLARFLSQRKYPIVLEFADKRAPHLVVAFALRSEYEQWAEALRALRGSQHLEA